jgi:antitoxin (DNA-binding transcriptional repressor) of toxin-antitoxin stability system
MHQVEVERASEQLPGLIQEALSGRDVVITQDQRPLVRLVKAAPSALRRRQAGSARGLIAVADDFDEPLEDFGPYM